MWNPFADATKGAVEGFGNAIANVISKVKADPTQVVTIEGDLQKAAIEYQSSVIGAVNATMQAESRSSSWLQQDWRPVVGITYALMLFNNYILMPWLAPVAHVPMIVIPDSVQYAIMSILGVTTMVTAAEKIFRPGNQT